MDPCRLVCLTLAQIQVGDSHKSLALYMYIHIHTCMHTLMYIHTCIYIQIWATKELHDCSVI